MGTPSLALQSINSAPSVVTIIISHSGNTPSKVGTELDALATLLRTLCWQNSSSTIESLLACSFFLRSLFFAQASLMALEVWLERCLFPWARMGLVVLCPRQITHQALYHQLVK